MVPFFPKMKWIFVHSLVLRWLFIIEHFEALVLNDTKNGTIYFPSDFVQHDRQHLYAYEYDDNNKDNEITCDKQIRVDFQLSILMRIHCKIFIAFIYSLHVNHIILWWKCRHFYFAYKIDQRKHSFTLIPRNNQRVDTSLN